MKYIFAFIAGALLLCSFAVRPYDTITGQVSLYGNIPFTFTGFETTDGHRYTLVTDDKKSGSVTREKLISLQGQLLTLHGRINPPGRAQKAGITLLKDGEFVVYSYETAGASGRKE